MLTGLRKVSEENIKKYENGVTKIIESENIVRIKKGDLSIEMKALDKEKEIVTNLINEIEESSVKTEQAKTDAEVLNIEIAKKVQEVNAKKEKADSVVKEAMKIKEEVETTVKENLNEGDIKAMAGILGNPPEKIKLILTAVACLKPLGTDTPFQSLFSKAGDCFKGIAGFIETGGAGHKMKASDLQKADGFIKQLFTAIKKDNKDITEMSQLYQYIKTKVSGPTATLYQWVSMMGSW